MNPKLPEKLSIEVLASIRSVQREEWEQLTCVDFPFSEYEFFSALETSGVIGTKSGWIPSYLTCRSESRLEAFTGLFKKYNSYGEYIFDWDWANAYHHHGVPYYPKLVASTPFTPATSPKLLMRPECDQNSLAAALIAEAKSQMLKQECSSLHYLFITKAEIPFFEKEGFLIRHSYQYHWDNPGYESFSNFLNALKPKRRKQIVREREQLKTSGIKIKIVSGEDLTPEHARIFFAFYLNTIRKMNAIPYLNAEFFRIIFESMRHQVVLMLAEEGEGENSEPIAGALYLRSGDHLYGRYWGAIKEVRNLHFELCYYQPIEWSIANKIKLFEAGAQGEHKLARGFLPKLTYSAHLIQHSVFRAAIEDFVRQEKVGIAHLFEDLMAHSPYLSNESSQ